MRPDRRGVLATGLAAALAPSLTRAATPDFAAIERASGGKLGVFAIDTGSGATTSWRADSRFPFCSSFKAPLGAFVLWKADRGQIGLSAPVRYGPSDLQGLHYTPVTSAHLAQGVLSVEALCEASVEYSDNAAANLLLRETGGPSALTAWMRALGDPAFDLEHTEPQLNYSRFGGRIDTTTPRAMAESFRRFAVGDVLKPGSKAQWIAWLVANKTGDRRLRAGLPKGWRVGDKTGTMDGDWCSTVDIAVAWPPGRSPLVIAGFVTGHPSTAAGETALAEVARQVAAWSAPHG